MKIFNTHLTQDDKHRVAAINGDIHGWSGYAQYGFFKAAFAAHDIRHLLMLGVYMGRDIAYILDILKRYYPNKEVMIVGVDKFSDTPCADWPPEILEAWNAEGRRSDADADNLRARFAGDAVATRAIQDMAETSSWQKAGFGEPPSVETARRNVEAFHGTSMAKVFLVKSDDEKYLAEHVGGFDLAYLDTSHDRATVARQIGQVKRPGFLNAGGILAGDDYLAINGWGVIEAVDELLPGRLIIENIIWAIEV